MRSGGRTDSWAPAGGGDERQKKALLAEGVGATRTARRWRSGWPGGLLPKAPRSMRLAWRNLCHDRLRFIVTIVGVAFSVFLMIFQGSLLFGFIKAASRVIDVSDGEIWISARGVPCFECSTPLPSRFREIAMGTPGVTAVQRIAAGSAVWQKPSGMRQIVYVVGAEPGVGGDFPLPYLNGAGGAVEVEAVLVDRSNAAMLEAAARGVEGEINRRKARVNHVIDGFGSFIGYPYLFTNYWDAVSYLELGPEEAQFLVVQAAPGYDLKGLQRDLQVRLPEVRVWRREEFSRRAQVYWIVQTGAGSALMTAALLGFIVGLVIVSQTIYATTMENLEEFATLKALGASRRYIQGVVLTQALISGLLGSTIGTAITIPMVEIIRGSVAWVRMPWWLPLVITCASLLMCAMASVVSVRKAVAVEPARVFRA